MRSEQKQPLKFEKEYFDNAKNFCRAFLEHMEFDEYILKFIEEAGWNYEPNDKTLHVRSRWNTGKSFSLEYIDVVQLRKV